MNRASKETCKKAVGDGIKYNYIGDGKKMEYNVLAGKYITP